VTTAKNIRRESNKETEEALCIPREEADLKI
jgi:hypothetical protein